MTEAIYYNNFSRILPDGTVKKYSYPRVYSKKNKQSKFTPEKKSEIKQRYKLGASKSRLVRDYDISLYYINKLLEEGPQ